MFRPNSIGQLERKTGADIHARPTFAPAVDCPFAPVRLETSTQPTTVRADSSGSRGAAEEKVSPRASILVAKWMTIAIGDRFAFDGARYLVMAVHKRRSVFGALDHLECHLEVMP